MFAGVWYVATMVAVGGNVMQQRCQCAIPAPLVFMIFSGPPMYGAMCEYTRSGFWQSLWRMARLNSYWLNYGCRARQQRMLGFTFRFVFGKARHIQADWPQAVHGARSTQSSALSDANNGSLSPVNASASSSFIARIETWSLRNCCHHCGFSAMTNLVPSVSTTGTLYFFAYSMAFMVASGMGSPGCATHQIRGENQCRGSGNHIFRNAFSPQLVHVAWSWLAKVRSPDSPISVKQRPIGPSTPCR